MENVSMFWMYVIAMLPSIRDFFGMFGELAVILLGIAVFVTALTLPICDFDDVKIKEAAKRIWTSKLSIVVLVTLFSFGSLSYFIPNYQQLAFIVGGHWAINNEDMREMPDNVAKVVNGYLEHLSEEE